MAEGPAKHTPDRQLGKRKLSTQNPIYRVSIEDESMHLLRLLRVNA